MESDVTLSAGSIAVVYVIYFGCGSGTAYYGNTDVQIETGAGTTYGYSSASAGDKFSVSLSEDTKTGLATAKLSNRADGVTALAVAPLKTRMKDISAELYGPGGADQPRFTTVTFGHLKFGEDTLAVLDPTQYDMYDGTTEVASSTSIQTDGTFQVTVLSASVRHGAVGRSARSAAEQAPLALPGWQGAPRAVPHLATRPPSSAPVHSDSYDGYVATSKGFESFTGSMNVPRVTCPKTGSAGVESAVTFETTAGDSLSYEWSASCNSGTADYQATDVAIHTSSGYAEGSTTDGVGDNLAMSMTYAKSGLLTARMKDLHSGLTATAEDSVTGTLTSIYAYVTYTYNSLPRFTKAQFNDLKFGSELFGSLTNTQYDLYSGTTELASSSSVSSTGSFSDTWLAS
jgi:hypothetical protein